MVSKLPSDFGMNFDSGVDEQDAQIPAIALEMVKRMSLGSQNVFWAQYLRAMGVLMGTPEIGCAD